MRLYIILFDSLHFVSLPVGQVKPQNNMPEAIVACLGQAGKRQFRTLLLGDSGYALKRWLITPVSRPTTRGENKVNRAHKKTRSLIERLFGILKRRWRILDHTGGTLCYSPSKVAKITIACCVLHNICRRGGTPLGAKYRPDPNVFSDDAPAGDTPCPSGDRQRADIISIRAGV